MAYLALIRHGQSVLNSQNRECGWLDSPLTDLGKQQAAAAARELPPVKWDYIFESDLTRSRQTTDEIMKVINDPAIIRISSPAIKERNYGIYANLIKSQVPMEVRRGWDFPVTGGECLKEVYERVIPYFDAEILPKLKEGHNVIISAHGNSLRALVKYLDKISDEEIVRFEFPVGEVRLYQFTSSPTPSGGYIWQFVPPGPVPQI
jgi:2,3-bisphosphoglycerate-dependent phosphoglycerate mutase